MRPDQHKKKKSAEYKKKHGIQNQGEKKKKESGQSERRKTADETKRLKQRNERSSYSDEELKESDESDHGQRHFSRRQIDNNWDRYKDIELDEEANGVPSVSKIGVDFEALINKPADPTSQFHFQDEKEWEDLYNNETKCKVGPMLIDCTSLADALREIPLDRRLEIEKKYFEDEHHAVGSLSSLTAHSATSLLSNDHLKVQVNTGGLKQKSSQKNFNFSKPGELLQTPKLKGNVREPTIDSQIMLSSMQKVEHNINHSKERRENYMMEEANLNHLLGLETKQQNSETRVETDQNKRKDAKQVTIEKSNVDLVPQLSKVQQESKEDLEDWLDSILD